MSCLQKKHGTACRVSTEGQENELYISLRHPTCTFYTRVCKRTMTTPCDVRMYTPQDGVVRMPHVRPCHTCCCTVCALGKGWGTPFTVPDTNRACVTQHRGGRSVCRVGSRYRWGKVPHLMDPLAVTGRTSHPAVMATASQAPPRALLGTRPRGAQAKRRAILDAAGSTFMHLAYCGPCGGSLPVSTTRTDPQTRGRLRFINCSVE